MWKTHIHSVSDRKYAIKCPTNKFPDVDDDRFKVLADRELEILLYQDAEFIRRHPPHPAR